MASCPTGTTPTNPKIEVLMTFLRLGLTSFGGPVAHIGYFRNEFVVKRGWLTEGQFSQLLAICQFLPGPASSQLGFSIGLLRAGWLGALFAFIAFTLPSAVILVLFASVLPAFDNVMGEAIIHGLKLVACAVVADALLGMFIKLCPDLKRKVIALIAAVLLIVTGVSWLQLLLIVVGGVVGRLWLPSATGVGVKTPVFNRYSYRIALFSFALFTVLLVCLPLFSQTENLWLSITHTFYQAGALVFGGGHVVLPLLEQGTVNSGLITADEFLAGYGVSQAIPGTLFTFAAYLGFLSAPESLSFPLAAIALLSIFLPGFLLVIAVLPYWEKLSNNKVFSSALAGVNAVVVGLLAAAFYDPVLLSSISNPIDIVIVISAFIALWWWKISPLIIVLWCVVASLLPVLVNYLPW